MNVSSPRVLSKSCAITQAQQKDNRNKDQQTGTLIRERDNLLRVSLRDVELINSIQNQASLLISTYCLAITHSFYYFLLSQI